MRRAILVAAILVTVLLAFLVMHYSCAFPYSGYWLLDTSGATRCCTLHTC